MKAIIEFLTNIGSAIVFLFKFVGQLLGDIVYVVTLAGKFVIQVPLYFAWFSPDLVAWVVIIVALAVVFKVLGREG